MARKLTPEQREARLLDDAYNPKYMRHDTPTVLDTDNTTFTDVTPEFWNRGDYPTGVLLRVQDVKGLGKNESHSPRTLAGVIRAVGCLLNKEWANVPDLGLAREDDIELLGERIAAGFHSLSGESHDGADSYGFSTRRTVFGDPAVTVALPHHQNNIPPEIRDTSTFLHTTATPDGYMASVSHGAQFFERVRVNGQLPAMLAEAAFKRYMGDVELVVASQPPILPSYDFNGGHSSTIDLNLIGDTLDSLATEYPDLEAQPLAVLHRGPNFVDNQIVGGVYDRQSGVGIGLDMSVIQPQAKPAAINADMRAVRLTHIPQHGAVFEAPEGLTFLRAKIRPTFKQGGRAEAFDTAANPLSVSRGPGIPLLVEASNALRAATVANGR